MRRNTWAAATAVLAMAGLVGCGGGGGGGSDEADLSKASSNTVAEACQGDPVKGGQLVYQRQSEAQSLDPINLRNGNGDIFATELIYNGLTRSDPTGKTDDLVGGVADKWEVSDDGKTYTFHIRDGIKFSNGDPVTAEDVKFTLDRFGDPEINQVLAVVAGGYESSRVIDDQNVEVKLSQPVASFLYNISIFPAFIVPKKLVEEQGNKFFRKPVGTGPYRVKSFTRGSNIVFERNPYYWEEGKPYLDEITFAFATDSNTRVLAVKNGEAQIADGVPFSQINDLNADEDVTLQTAKVPLFLGLWLNHERGPLADRNVRQAMQHALNREEINKGIFRGVGTIPNSVLPPLKYDAPLEDLPAYGYDVEKAKQLMADSKFADGFSITLQYPSGYDYYKQLGLLMQQQFKAIGIDLKLSELDPAEVTNRFNNEEYDITFPYAQFTSDVVVPDEYATFLTDSEDIDGFFTNWEDEAIRKQVREFAATPDEAKRAELWPQIQKALLDETPVINVMNIPYVNVHAANVCGTSINALGADHLEDTWIAGGAGN